MNAPIPFTWDGESMVCPRRFQLMADKLFTVGENYPLIVQEPRSRASHNHYFASIEEAWRNLPEGLAEHFPTSEHLRKHALIKADYADKRSFVAGSKAEAVRLASFVKPMDEYAIITVNECVVTVYTAQSQSVRAMGKEPFQHSKEKVLEIVSAMVGVKPALLAANAERAA